MGELFQRPVATEPLPFTGERLTSDLTGETPVEHWHRYLLARELARGRVVLDIACGEGYGSALLAQAAASVVGVDVADDAVEHARRAYGAPNLQFQRGDARHIPLPDASVDLVVSFETLEHFVEHDAFLQEVRRILRPDGALLVSTPERDTYSPEPLPPNPYHAKELTEAEFEALLRGRFGHVTLQGQRVMLGSVLAGGTGTAEPFLCFERRGAAHFEASVGLARLRYVVALASDSPAWRLPPSVYIDTGRIGYIDGPRLEALNDQPPTLRDGGAGEIERLSQALRDAQAEAASLRDALAAQTRRAEALERATERAERAALAAREQADHLAHRLGNPNRSVPEAEALLAAMRASTSWRITAPLRALRNIAGRR